jgi:ZIP family zinc transporter
MRFIPILVACVTLASTGVGGMVAVRFRDRLHFLLGFSSGAVLAVALFDILPEVFAMGGPSYMPIVAIGFLAFFGLERYTALHRAREHVHVNVDTAHEPELGALAAAGLVLHSFLDGVAIGIGFQTGPHVGVLIAMGIIAHDLSDGMNTVTVVLAHGNPVNSAVMWLIFDMVAPVLGAAVTVVYHPAAATLPWVLAFFVGSFLYIGASDLLPEAREHDSPWVAVATIVGMVVVYLSTLILRR